MKITISFVPEEQESVNRIVTAVKSLVRITRSKSTAPKQGNDFNHVYLSTAKH